MKYHILSIGISKHQSSIFNTLQFADKDAADFYTLFTSNINDIGYKKLLVNSEATLSEIRTALGKELRQAVGSNDAFFFFFSGHGATAENQDGTGLEQYLIPFDATSDITNSGVSVDYLKDVFDHIKCKAAYIFVDSCFSGSLNSKGYSAPSLKSFRTVKTLLEQSFGEGSIVFTASKAQEEALEDLDNYNGLFTYFVLQELQKERVKDLYPITDIVTPIIEQVTARAKKKYNHIQTPTVKISLEGPVYLPICKKPLKFEPTQLQVPKDPELIRASFPIPEISFSNTEIETQLDEIISFVTNGSDLSDIRQKATFERFCWKSVKEVKLSWEKIFSDVGADLSKIPDAVTQLESAAYQLMILSGVIAAFGSEKHMRIYADSITDILDWKKGRAGLVALISIPEILLTLILYVVGAVCLSENRLEVFKILLLTNIQDDDIEGEPLPLYQHNEIHYCDALGGSGTKVADHIRSILETYTWLPLLCPRLEDKIIEYQLQVNFILAMLVIRNGERFWPDFGRFYSDKLKSLVDKIKYDSDFQDQIALLFDVKKEEVGQVLTTNLMKIRDQEFGGGYFWQSIDSKIFLPKE